MSFSSLSTTNFSAVSVYNVSGSMDGKNWLSADPGVSAISLKPRTVIFLSSLSCLAIRLVFHDFALLLRTVLSPTQKCLLFPLSGIPTA